MNVTYGTEATSMVCEIVRYFHDDREIIRVALEKHGSFFTQASPDLRGDKDLALVAMENTSEWSNGRGPLNRGDLLSHMSTVLRNDRDIVRYAVDERYCNLKHASDELKGELKGDRVFMMSMLDINAAVLEWLPDELRNDCAFMMETVDKRPCALEYASELLLRDPDLVILAISKELKYIHWASRVKIWYPVLLHHRYLITANLCRGRSRLTRRCSSLRRMPSRQTNILSAKSCNATQPAY